jgi:hypothetical protein
MSLKAQTFKHNVKGDLALGNMHNVGPCPTETFQPVDMNNV